MNNSWGSSGSPIRGHVWHHVTVHYSHDNERIVRLSALCRMCNDLCVDKECIRRSTPYSFNVQKNMKFLDSLQGGSTVFSGRSANDERTSHWCGPKISSPFCPFHRDMILQWSNWLKCKWRLSGGQFRNNRIVGTENHRSWPSSYTFFAMALPLSYHAMRWK